MWRWRAISEPIAFSRIPASGARSSRRRQIDTLVAAVTTYVARRLVERERALAGDTELGARDRLIDNILCRRRRRTMQALFLIGLVVGMATGAASLLAIAALFVP